ADPTAVELEAVGQTLFSRTRPGLGQADEVHIDVAEHQDFTVGTLARHGPGIVPLPGSQTRVGVEVGNRRAVWIRGLRCATTLPQRWWRALRWWRWSRR